MEANCRKGTETPAGVVDMNADSGPVATASVGKVYVNTDFAVVVSVGANWRALHGLTTEDIWRAGLNAHAVLERDVTVTAAPCRRCSPTSRAVIELGLSGRADFGPFAVPDVPGVERFRFDRCRSRCSSSRLHLGSRIQVALRLPHLSHNSSNSHPNAATAQFLYTQPFELLSKKPTSARASKRRASASSPLEVYSSSGASPGSSSSSSLGAGNSPATAMVVPESPPTESGQQQQQ